MNKIVIKYTAIAILLIPMISFAESTPAPSTTPSTGSSQSTASAEIPSTGDSTSTATPNIPSTGGSSSTATDSTPSTGGSSSTATNTTPSTGGSSSTATNTNTTPNNPPTGGSSSGSSSSSSSGSRVSIYGCPMLTSYLKYGANNDSVQVTKLQNFLNSYEKMNVAVTGIFDKQTENAVIAFQNKYSSEIMGPWNKTNGTGYVYLTTLKKINQIACNIPLTLNVTERSLINEALTRN